VIGRDAPHPIFFLLALLPIGFFNIRQHPAPIKLRLGVGVEPKVCEPGPAQYRGAKNVFPGMARYIPQIRKVHASILGKFISCF